MNAKKQLKRLKSIRFENWIALHELAPGKWHVEAIGNSSTACSSRAKRDGNWFIGCFRLQMFKLANIKKFHDTSLTKSSRALHLDVIATIKMRTKCNSKYTNDFSDVEWSREIALHHVHFPYFAFNEWCLWFQRKWIQIEMCSAIAFVLEKIAKLLFSFIYFLFLFETYNECAHRKHDAFRTFLWTGSKQSAFPLKCLWITELPFASIWKIEKHQITIFLLKIFLCLFYCDCYVLLPTVASKPDLFFCVAVKSWHPHYCLDRKKFDQAL